jgi:hypothetical protein
MPTRFGRAAIVSVTTDESSRHEGWSVGMASAADLDPLHQLPDDGLAL